MRDKFLKKNKLMFVLICMAFVVVSVFAVVFGLQSEGQSVNVYAAMPAPMSGQFVQMPTSTDFTANNFHVTTRAAITVLNHGMNSDASHWSNNGNRSFAFDNRSLIERLRRQNNANVFWARMTESTSFELLRLPVQNQFQTYGNRTGVPNSNLQRVGQLTLDDINRHMIIVFQLTQGNYGASSNSHETKHNEFRFMLHSVARSFGSLNFGVYPRINLIGHSRGGLTNMEFANRYPRLVCSMFALGTPFLGSNFGRVNFFSQMVTGNYRNLALQDINSESLQNRLMQDWNRNRQNGRGSHIRFFPMSGHSTLGMIADAAGGAVGQVFASLLGQPPLVFTALVTYASTIIWGEEQRAGITSTPWSMINNSFYRAFSGWAFLWLGRTTLVHDDL
ncbi:MAG: alpha/beta hydrolase, partial [Firmicutes bacterium]|nr:alpha/beta hydrolase [Bacillota bacterium]